MDYKTVATILFRILGVSYFLFGIFYAPYLLVTAAFSDTFIISTLAILTILRLYLSFLLKQTFGGFGGEGLRPQQRPTATATTTFLRIRKNKRPTPGNRPFRLYYLLPSIRLMNSITKRALVIPYQTPATTNKSIPAIGMTYSTRRR